jgi:hypothetical protein
MRGFSTHARLVLPALLALSLSACDKDLQQQVDRLEAELRGVRSDTRETVEELKARVIAAETRVGVPGTGKTLDERITLLEGSFGEVLSMKSRDNEMVYLRANLQGHAPLLTDHGTFLVRMEGIDLNVESGGYTVHLNIGNPQAIAIQQFTLRGDHDRVSGELRAELINRLSVAGITVDECGFTHLAYAPEIAGAMLRRQQAAAVVAARETLVAGAVGMVEMALAQLSEKNVVELDDERKAAMVSNLMVVLCGERETQPIVNAGSLY